MSTQMWYNTFCKTTKLNFDIKEAVKMWCNLTSDKDLHLAWADVCSGCRESNPLGTIHQEVFTLSACLQHPCVYLFRHRSYLAQYVGLEPTSLSASCIQSSALTIRMYCMSRQVAYHHLLCIGVNYLITVRRLTSNIVDGLPMAGHAGLEPAT